MASLSLKNICKVYPNGFEAVKDFGSYSHIHIPYGGYCEFSL